MSNLTTGKYKTTRLIELAHNNDNLIVCFNQLEADRVFQQSLEMGRRIHKPITFRNYVRKEYAESRVQSLLIDNIDLCVASLGNVGEMTVRMN